MRHIFKQKRGATRNRVSEVPIDDGIIQKINKRNRQSLLGNRIDSFPQRRKILNNNLRRIKQSLRKRRKHAKNSDGKIPRRWNDYMDDDDINEEGISNMERFPIWQISESTVAAINLDSTASPSMETGMINQSLLAFEGTPWQLENLDDRSENEAVYPIARQYPNSGGSFDLNASNKNLIFSKIANPKSEIKVDARSPTFKELGNKMLLPAYHSGILAGVDSPSSGRPQEFQRQYNGQRDFLNSYDVKEELFNRPTGSNKRFLLVPVSRSLYILKNVQESPRTTVDGIIIPKRYKLLERNKDNATSAILSFKAHMHHDVKDVGRAYLQRGNHRLFDHNANYLYPILEPPKESTNPTENPMSYPDFLYPGIAFQTGPNLIDATPEIFKEQMISPVPDNSFADINLHGGINSDSSALLSSSFLDISNYDISSKENANNGQSTKLDDGISLCQQDSGNYGNSLGYSEFELTTTDFRDTFDTHDDSLYTPATLEMYLTNDKKIFDMSQSEEDEFSTRSSEDKLITEFTDDISTQHRAAFDASADKDNTFFPNITYTFVNNAILPNSGYIDKDNEEYGISIPEYNDKKSTHFNDFDYDNSFRSISQVSLSNCTSNYMDSFLNAEDYVTSAPLLLNTDEWPLKKAQSNVENSHALLMAMKPLSSELQKLLNAIQLVNRSISDVQSRLCDKKNVVRLARIEQESKDRKATNIAKLADEVDHYDSDFPTESFNSQSLDKRRIKTKGRSVAERDVKIRRKTNSLFLNKLTTSFHKRESAISDSEVQSGRRNFLKKRKLSEGEFPKSGDVVGRRLPHSRFNRNLKSLTKNYVTRVKPIQQLIESGLKRMKRTTTPIVRLSRLIKNNVSSGNNFAEERVQIHQGNDQSRSIISLNNMPFLDISPKKDNSAHLLSADKRDLTQRNAKGAISSEISGKEKKFSFTDPQFYKEATAYIDILRLLGKTEKSEYATDVWITQNLTESLPPLIFTTTEFSVSTLTFLPYFTEAPTITAPTIAEKKEVPEVTELTLYEYVTVTEFGYSDYEERNYTRMYKDYEYEEITSKISEIVSLTQSPVTFSAFTITMPTTLPLFYTTELTILPIDEAAILTTEKITIISTVAIITEVTPIIIPTTENFTTESVILLTPFLEGMTDITLKITIPIAKISVEETTASIAEIVTEEETVESTSTTLVTEITRSSFIETNISLYTFSTISLFETTETELTIETSIVPVSTSLITTKGPVTSEFIFSENITLYKTESTTAIASSPTVLERTETILSTTEIAITTLIPDESPVSQIEKTITAEETATEIPTTTETTTPIETTITTITTETSTEIPTITKPTTITKTSISTEILTTFKTPTRRTTETLTPFKTKTTTEISTSTETTTITETIVTINKTVTTAGTPTSIETSTSKIPTISTILTTIATTMKTLTATAILTTHKTPITKKTTGAKTLTPTLIPKTKTTTETSTIEISTSTETTTEILTEALTTTKTSAFMETSITSEISTTSTIPTIIKTTAITETLTPTKILATTKILTTEKTTSTKAFTPTITETPSSTQIITEISTTTESSGTTEISVISTTYITTKLFTTSESTTLSVATMSPKEFFSTLTTFTTIFSTETTESTLTSSIIPITTSVKTTVSSLKLTTTTPLQTQITNTTLSETPYITISSIFLTTTKRPVTTTSFKTTVSTTSLKITTTTPLLLVTSTISSETPNTTLSTFLIEETTASSIPTTIVSSLETTTAVLSIPTTMSTIETFLTTSSITTVNATVSSTTASAITAEILESTISSLIYFTVTTPSITKIPITTPIKVDTGTTAYETTSTVVTSSFLTETIESTTSSIIEYEETKEYEEYYYESTKEEIATVTSVAELTTKERTMTWITTEEITIIEETTPITSFTIPFFIETTTEATSLVIETITLSTISEETLLIEKVTVTPVITIEETSTFSEVTLISTETSTVSTIETSTTSLVSTTAVMTASLLEETITEITETSLITTTVTLLPTTERPKYATILEAVVTVTLAPFSESILSIIITSETPATTPEVISTLPKPTSEEFMMSVTESPITYTTRSSTTLFIETTVPPTVSVSTAITEKTLEAETEYYVAKKEPFYEEEYEEYKGYDTEIPTGKWYYYDEYETTTKKKSTVAIKYTKLPKEKTSPPFIKGTTSLYEIETSEFTRYSTPFERETLTYINMTSTAATGISYTYTEEEVTSISVLETSASTVVENITTVKETEFTASSASEEVESTTMGLTFGSTEEYTLPSTTIFKIPTEPLEYLTLSPKYTDLERFTQTWRVTSPKVITKPKEIPEIELKKTTTSERVLTGETEETEETEEKLTSFFVSSTLTTLPEKGPMEVHAMTMSTAFSEIEGIIETSYEITTVAMTEEEIILRVTPFITTETEIELVFTTTSKTIEREEQKEQLLQRLDDLKQHEREMAEREERLKEREKQWDIEKEKRKKMLQREKEKEKNITIVTSTTESYVTTTILITSPIHTISTRNLTTISTTEIEVTSSGFDTFVTTLSLVEITTVPTETTPFSITEEIFVTYTTEKMEETTVEGSTPTTYATEETEETVISYTEKSTSTYITEEEVKITDYVTLAPKVTTSIMDLYNISLASVETTTLYTIEGMYTASYISETTPFSIIEEIISVTYTTEKTEEVTIEGIIPMTYAEETEKAVIFYTTEKSIFITYLTEEIEEVQITDYVTLTPYVTTSIVDLYGIGSIETATPIEEMYTTSYMTLSEPLFASPTITSPITLVTDKFITLPIATFSERFEETSVTLVTTPTWNTTEEIYTATYTDIYKALFTSPALEFTSTTTSPLTISITEVKYDEEIERLKEELRKKERELKEREKILLEREKILERDIMEFERYMKEFERKKTSIIPSEKSTVLTSLSTPVPPTEKTTLKAQLTTQIKKVTEKKENRTTTKMVTSQPTEMKDIEEKKRTKYISEKTVTQKEEEIVTKRICLNVLENTTIPLDKRRRDIVTKKICLPYFPEKNEEKKSVGRLSRRLLTLQSTRKIRKPRLLNAPLDFRYRKRVKETTRKIDNLQLSHHEWLSNETTKSLRHFKGFTRIYRKMRKFPKKVATIIDTRRKTTSDFQDRTPSYEQRVLDYESIFQPTVMSMLDNKKYRKRNTLFRYDLSPARKSDFPIDDKTSVRKRDVSSVENNARFWKGTANVSNKKATTAIAEEDGIYTVNVLHLSYNEDKQTHEVISAKPNEDELTAILSESSNDIYVTKFGKDRKITTSYYEIEEKDDLKEEDDELTDEMRKKMEKDEDYIEDMIEGDKKNLNFSNILFSINFFICLYLFMMYRFVCCILYYNFVIILYIIIYNIKCYTRKNRFSNINYKIF